MIEFSHAWNGGLALGEIPIAAYEGCETMFLTVDQALVYRWYTESGDRHGDLRSVDEIIAYARILGLWLSKDDLHTKLPYYTSYQLAAIRSKIEPVGGRNHHHLIYQDRRKEVLYSLSVNHAVKKAYYCTYEINNYREWVFVKKRAIDAQNGWQVLGYMCSLVAERFQQLKGYS